MAAVETLLRRPLGRGLAWLAKSGEKLRFRQSRAAAFLVLALATGVRVAAQTLLPSLARVRGHGRVELAEASHDVK
jgi:hypothetical protein